MRNPFGCARTFLRLSLAATLLATGAACRYQTIWAGAEFDRSGDAIRLVADEPLCGCLVLRNRSDRDIMLRSTLHRGELGLQVLPRTSTMQIRFDWAGPNGNDIYRLDGFDASGGRVNLRDAVSIEDNGWPWQPCGPAACPYGPLTMNAGENRR